MATVEGQLSGARDFRARLNISYSGVQSGNSSRFDWSVQLIDAASWGSWTNATCTWSASIGGVGYSGTFTIPQNTAGQVVRTVGSGSTWISHDSNGYRPGFASSAYISVPHTNIGSGGSGNAWVDAPRIPKVPAAPTPLGIDQVTATSFRYRFSGGDNGGSAITSWQVQYATNSAFTGATTFNGTGTDTISGLTPGYTYWVRSRGNNAIGSGPWSAALSTELQLPAPAFSSWSQNANGGLVASWAAPSVTDGLTGYRLQVATNEGFTTGVQNIDLGNVLTHTVTGLPGGRLYYARVAARTSGGVNTYSDTLSTMLVLSSGDLDGWTRVGTKPANIAYFTAEGIRRGITGTTQALWLESLSTGAASLAADTFGMQKTITGLTVGKAYRFTAKATLAGAPLADSYRLSVVSETSGDPLTVTSTATDFDEIEFVADATSVVVRVLLAEAVTIPSATDEVERVAIHNIKLLELATDYPVRLRSTVYESSLANHFDLAANSVGATWYVAKDGVTRFLLPGTALPLSAVFSDEASPGALSYIDVSAAYDTRSMVNRLDVTNYGVDAEGLNEENDELVVSNATSIAAYGNRAERLSVNLWDQAPYDESLNDRLTSVLDAHDQPQLLVSSLRWNAQENLAAANALEVGQRISVQFKGTVQDSQIVAIQHDILPTRWIITLSLQRLTP